MFRARTETGNGIKQTSTMRTKSMHTSMQNRCKNDAQQSDAKMMEHGANIDSKRVPTSTIDKNNIPKIMLTFDITKGPREGLLYRCQIAWN